MSSFACLIGWGDIHLEVPVLHSIPLRPLFNRPLPTSLSLREPGEVGLIRSGLVVALLEGLYHAMASSATALFYKGEGRRI